MLSQPWVQRLYALYVVAVPAFLLEGLRIRCGSWHSTQGRFWFCFSGSPTFPLWGCQCQTEACVSQRSWLTNMQLSSSQLSQPQRQQAILSSLGSACTCNKRFCGVAKPFQSDWKSVKKAYMFLD